MKNSPFDDLLIRFLLGGGAVAACYIFLQVIPWKSFAGVFAAFPAVMIAAVIMAGVFEGSKQAADIALGATAGMLGCTVCVIVAVLGFIYLQQWGLSLVIATIAWFISSLFFIKQIHHWLQKRAKHI
ncbi:DUF3147 family protein [Syntrophomonas erecta]